MKNDCSITETTSINNDSRVDVSSLGGLGTQCRRQRFASFTPAICAKPSSYPVSVAKEVGNHPEYANSIHIVQDKLSLLAHSAGSYPVFVAKEVGNHLESGHCINVTACYPFYRKGKGKASMKDTKQSVTGIKEVDDLVVRIKNLEEIFSNLRNRKPKQKEVRLETDDETSLNDDTYSNDDKSSNDDTSSSEDLINYLSTRDIQWQLPKNTQEEQPKPLYVPIKTQEEEPLQIHIVYPHSHFASNTLPSTSSNEMYMEEEEVVFIIHTKGYFEYDPLRLKLLHTDNDVHSFFDVAVKNGSIHLYVAHKKQNLGKYYYKNMEWEEDDAGLRCCSSTPFHTRFKRKISKSKKTGVIHDEGASRKREKSLVNGGSKGKEKLFEDECMCGNGNEGVVTIYKRAMVNRKAKMVEVVGAVKTRRDRGVVIKGKEEVVSKRGVGSRKMHGTSVK
ncbi:hypothetical protein Tco_0452945, partial [Tanacetum coccineum]